jgi:copper resistance protein B
MMAGVGFKPDTRGLRAGALMLALVFAWPGAAHAQPAAGGQDPHAGHVMEPPPTPARPAQVDLPPFIPRLTDEDRRAAFPDTEAHHAAHDKALNYFVLLDQFEWQGGSVNAVNADTTGWFGRDRDRLWFRAEGDGESGRIGEAHVHALYGRQVSRWWDVVAGLRQDVRPGPAQTWAAFGVQGLAPYWFEVEATAYVSTSGQVQARLEAEYDLRLTNRWIVQPLVEAELSGTDDAQRQVGAGLARTDVGFRLRYLARREFAPYAGLTWTHRYGATAGYARARGEATKAARVVAGVRMWF